MISIIVPAYDEAANIGRCIEALLSQEGLSVPPEIIVVDDGSTDGTADIARAYAGGTDQIRVISKPNGGVSAARNTGAWSAHGDVLLFTDADCRPAPDWAATLVRTLEDPDVAGVMGLQHSDQTSLVARVVQAEYDEKHAALLSHRRVTFADTATVGFRADVFRDAGGYRESLRNFEDTELAFRLADEGHKLVVAPEAVVLHRHLETIAGYARRKFRIAYWGSAVYRQYPDKVADDSRTPWSMRAQMILAPLTLLGLALAPLTAIGRQLAILSGLAFLVSGLPFARFARSYGPGVSLLAPIMFFVRGLALSAGLALGLARLATGRHEAGQQLTTSTRPHSPGSTTAETDSG